MKKFLRAFGRGAGHVLLFPFRVLAHSGRLIANVFEAAVDAFTGPH